MPDSSTSFRLSQLLSIIRIVLGPKLPKFVIWTSIVTVVYFNSLVPPFIIGKVVDFLSNYKSGESINRLYFLSLALTMFMFTAAMIRLQAKTILGGLCIDAGYQTRVLAFERLMQRSVRWHEQENTGNKVQRISTGSFSVQELLRVLHTDLLSVLTAFIGVIGSFFLYSAVFGMIGLFYLLTFLAIQTYFFRRIRGLVEASKQATENASGVYVEGASNILTIKTLNVEENITSNVMQRERAARDVKLHINRLVYWKWRCFQSLTAITMGSFVLFVGLDVVAGGTSAGALVMLFTYFRSLHEAAGDSTGFFDVISDHWISIGRLAPIFDESGKTLKGTSPFPTQWSNISLHNIQAQYIGDVGGLKDISLTINRGEHIGIVGTSGAGKSTIAKVLLGLHPLQSGTYSIGEVPFSNISPTELSDHISMALQDSELFNLSLRENITVMREVSSDRLLLAMRIAQLLPVLEKLDSGLDTIIGEKGYRLSGGERQRLGIARAICKNPDIIIMDEATSSLDGDTEVAIHEALQTELGDKTMILIAHRLSTLRNVDRIVVIEDGRIVEEGAPDKLLELQSSRFALMWRTQHAES